MNNTNIPLSNKDDQFIINYHNRFSVCFIAGRLKRSPNKVWQRMIELGLRAREDEVDYTTAPVEKNNINKIIQPYREKQEGWIFGKLAESVILGMA